MRFTSNPIGYYSFNFGNKTQNEKYTGGEIARPAAQVEFHAAAIAVRPL
jgi:hypothetical protein